MAIRGAIFDMDGTLLDSMHIWVSIPNQYIKAQFKEHGVEKIPKFYKDIGGITLLDIANFLIDYLHLDKTPQSIIDEINDMALKEYRKTATVKPGTVEFLEKLKARGVKMCIATASDRFMVEEILTKLDILKYFDRIFTCGEVGSNKSSPDIFEAALSFLGTDKKDTYVFEDTYAPVKTTKEAGFNVVAVADKWSADKRELIEPLADIYTANINTINIEKL